MRTFLVLIFISLISASQSLKITCEKCDSSQGDCNSGTCDGEGIWCTASILENKATGTRTVHKDCATTNPSGKQEDGCAKDPLPDGTDRYRCGCNSGNFCTSETNLVRMQAMLNNRFILGGVSAGGGTGGGPITQSGPTGQQAPLPGGQNQFPPVQSNTPNLNNTFAGPNSNPSPNSNQPGSINQFNQPGNPNNQQFQQFPNGNNPQTVGNPQFPPSNVNNPQSPPQNVNSFQVGTNPQFPSQNGPINGQNVPNQQFPPQNGNNPQFPGQGGGIGQGPTQVNNNGQNPQFANSPFPQGGAGIGTQPLPTNSVPVDGTGRSNPNFGSNNPNHNTVTDGHSNPSVGANTSTVPGGGGQSPNSVNGDQQRTAAAGPSSGSLTCACSEQACNGPCKGAACYVMTFPADKVQNQAFAGRQGNVEQTGCTDDISNFPGGSVRFNRPNVTYRFKLNGQDVVVPAQAVYCRDGDFCNTPGGGARKLSIATITLALSAAAVLAFQRF